MIIKLFLVIAVSLLTIVLSNVVFGQAPSTPTSAEILDNAEAQSKAYVEAFKNLLADETKTFEIFDKNGNVKKRRTVVSNFLVYPLSKTADQVVEFRNVLSVDGKTLDNADKRAQGFFEKVAQAESSENEIKKLRDESTRYDLEIAITGMTLFQSLALNSNLRPFFEFEIKPVTKLNGRDVYTIAFQQVKDSPDITVNADKLRPTGRPGLNYEIDVDKNVSLNSRIRGTLVIDAETFRVWQEEREITIQPAGFLAPMTVIDDSFEYQTSDFGILTPKAITHLQYEAKIKEMRAVKDVRISFEYGHFTRADVGVKSSEVKPN